MLDPIREVDRKPAAQRVEVDGRTRKPAACQCQRIDATNRDRLAFKAGRFCVQKSKIEFSIVYYERVRTNKGQKLVGNDPECWLTSEKFRSQAVDGKCVLGCLAFIASRVCSVISNFTPGRKVRPFAAFR